MNWNAFGHKEWNEENNNKSFDPIPESCSVALSDQRYKNTIFSPIIQ